GVLLVLLWIHSPDTVAGVAGAAVDLVQDAPRIGNVDEPVLDQRRCFAPFVASRAAEYNRIGELEIFDVVLVDARERREALTIVGAVVHKPVLRLVIGVD